MWEVYGVKVFDVLFYDVGIVFIGMGEYNNDLKMFFICCGGDWIWQVIMLYKIGKIKKIFIIGDNGDLMDKGLYEVLQFKEVFVIWGILEQDIIVELKLCNIYENVVEIKKFLDCFYLQYYFFLFIILGWYMC